MKKTFFLLPFLLVPQISYASWFEISGWVPYWRTASGTEQALTNIKYFKELDPFAYSVAKDGTLVDLGQFSESPWPGLVSKARASNVRVVPSIMGSDALTMHKVLSDPRLRLTHIQSIASMVKRGGYSGVDIDYENLKSETGPYFNSFIADLKDVLGESKWLSCTVQVKSFLIDENSATNNDHAALAKFCDRVKIMAYDQSFVDQKFTRTSTGPYVPVADLAWVEKIIAEAKKSIPREKIILGIPTYGYEFEVTPLTSGFRYKKLWAFNPRYAVELSQSLGIKPERNIAGELSFTYYPKTPGSEPTAMSTRNLASVTLSPTGIKTNILWWSDARAIEDKVKLAQRLGLRGVAIFKIDGATDPGLVSILKKYYVQ